MNKIHEDINYCKRYLKEHGHSYYFSSWFFPRDLRQATYALYAFVRVPDEYVDNQDNSLQKLKRYKKAWIKAYTEQGSKDPVLNATAHIFHTYKIPFTYSLDFLNAMAMDIHKRTYKNFAELKRYMYGSAAVVGLMMATIIGFKDKAALRYAEDLGYAMQLTNFLRDIGEDHALRKRIYLPQDELLKFNVSTEHFTHKILDTNFKELMKFNISRARRYYRSALKGVPYLAPQGQKAVTIALVLYRAILNKIEENEYDVFDQRAHTGLFEKVALTIGALYG